MYFAYITARVHQMIMQQWHAATTTRHSYTLTYQFLTDLQTFVELLRDIQFGPRGPPRRASAYEISKSTARGFRISEWISGFHSGFLDFSLDFCRQVSSCMFWDILVIVPSLANKFS